MVPFLFVLQHVSHIYLNEISYAITSGFSFIPISKSGVPRWALMTSSNPVLWATVNCRQNHVRARVRLVMG